MFEGPNGLGRFERDGTSRGRPLHSVSIASANVPHWCYKLQHRLHPPHSGELGAPRKSARRQVGLAHLRSCQHSLPVGVQGSCRVQEPSQLDSRTQSLEHHFRARAGQQRAARCECWAARDLRPHSSGSSFPLVQEMPSSCASLPPIASPNSNSVTVARTAH